MSALPGLITIGREKTNHVHYPKENSFTLIKLSFE